MTKDIIKEVSECLNAVEFPFERMPRKNWRDRVPQVLIALGKGSRSTSMKELVPYSALHQKVYGSREIIELLNAGFGTDISRGSYDEVRRSCVKYLVEAGLVLKNPDDPNRATNSPASGYALSEDFTRLCRAWRSEEWEAEKDKFQKKHGSLRKKLAQPRQQNLIEISYRGSTVSLSPGAHNQLQKDILESFLPRFAPKAELVYLGDSTDRQLLYDSKLANDLELPELLHEQLPDVVAYDRQNNWIFFVEAVTSAGHISELRKLELDRIMTSRASGRAYVTAFPDRETMRKFIADLAWETEVWVANDPSHMVHFNGHKFLGPY